MEQEWDKGDNRKVASQLLILQMYKVTLQVFKFFFYGSKHLARGIYTVKDEMNVSSY